MTWARHKIVQAADALTSCNSLQPIYLLDFHVFALPERCVSTVMLTQRRDNSCSVERPSFQQALNKCVFPNLPDCSS